MTCSTAGTVAQAGTGNRFKLLMGLLTSGCRDKPVDVTVTEGGTGVSVSDVTITVAALSGPIAEGSRLVFEPSGVEVYLTADVDTGDTTIPIEAATAAIPAGEVANYVGLIQLQAVTSTGVNIANNDETFQTLEDPNGFSDGVIVSADWSLPIEAKFLPGSETEARIGYLARNAARGKELWVQLELAPAAGKTTGEIYEGPAALEGRDLPISADGIVSYSSTIKGRRTPTYVRAV